MKLFKRIAVVGLSALLLASTLVMVSCDKNGSVDDSVNSNSNSTYEYEIGKELTMNTGWLYSPNDYENGESVNLNEKDFEQVTIPHANKILEKHIGDDFLEQIDSYRFISWYRRHFTLDETYAGKSVYINFEGVATVADVYVNGEYVGTHKGAYNSFTFDITDFLKTDGSDNVIAVKVDSTKHSDIPPEGGRVDYCLFGGIVRDVNLIVKEKLHIDNIFITTPNLKNGDSSANIEVDILNGSKSATQVKATATVKDAEGKVVAIGEGSLASGAGSQEVLTLKTSQVENVTLWDTENPYLYTVEVELRADGKILDKVTERLGFRYFEFINTDSSSAFYLNGEKTLINGINRHEQWPWIGRAVNNKYQAADADLIKATGFNAVRCSHYPQDPSFLDRCDEIGLLVFEEAPGWQHIGNEEWQNLHKTNIKDMIMLDRNHTSIISWGVRINESGNNHELYEETNKIAHELDSTRPTHGVRSPWTPEVEYQEDILCINYKYPDIPVATPYMVTEYAEDWGGDGLPGFTTDQSENFINSFAWPLEYLYSNEFCSGGFAWSMFDYDTENETATQHVFASGVYDLYRYPKPVAYFYKSQKDPADETVLYIANYWADEGKQDVWVLSNCDEVELFVNGKSVGRTKPNHYTKLPHPIFRFNHIDYEEGTLKAVGYIDGKKVETATVKTPENAKEIRLTPDYDTIIADGADFTSVTVELIDKNGTVLPYASDEVTITVEGAGKFIGEKTVALEGGHIAFFVQSEYLKTGEITCTVKLANDDRISGSCKLKAVEYTPENELPVSEYEQGTEEGVIFVLRDLNNTYTTSSAPNHFTYIGNWSYSAQVGCFEEDNHYTEEAGLKYTLTFYGTGATIYGSMAPNHGIMKASCDSGDVVTFDCYSPERMENQTLFEIHKLPEGEHVITVEVTGEKNKAAYGKFINVDRAIIE